MVWIVEGHPLPPWAAVDQSLPLPTAPEILVDAGLFALADDTGAVIVSGDFTVSTWNVDPPVGGGWTS